MQHLRANDGDIDFSSHYPVALFAGFRPEEDNRVPNFHNFPYQRGLSVNDENGAVVPLENINEASEEAAEDAAGFRANPSRFMQRWLYFEVLRETFWEAFQASGRKFQMESFIMKANNRGWITTAKLGEYLELWKAFEIKQQTEAAPGQTARLIRIQQVLDRAHYFVRSFLSVPDESTPPRCPGIDPYVTLSIMVLGETLSRANRHVREAINFDINGWQHHTANCSQGWGYCTVVLQSLSRPFWCKRKAYMLQALFNNNVIGLLYAIQYQGFPGYEHQKCTKDYCTAFTVHGKYQLAHAPDRVNCPCSTIGPDPKEVAEVLRNGDVPLLRIQNLPGGPQIKVEAMQAWDKDYAIFSHVWVDGYGNPDSNKIHSCVLGFFEHLFKQISQGSAQGRVPSPELFWIDTLAVPVRNQYPKENKLAISKMHDIYANAKYTIVLDSELISQPVSPMYAPTAMRITMCGWMTRLWTLQEALLSKNIYFSFCNDVYSLDQLESLYERNDMQIQTCIPSIARTYYRGIIGTERHRLKHPDMIADRQKTTNEFVGRVWKAAQWRMTTHSQHETLALATLLNLTTSDFTDTDETPLSFKGLDSFSGDGEKLQQKKARILERRMCRIIILLSKLRPCPIPAAMIFLPGPRLSEEGFGWAPRTWLSSQLVLTPDPFTIPTSETALELPFGLRVQYPGFMLHRLHSGNGSSSRDTEYHFPVDSNLHEWYRISPTDSRTSLPKIKNSDSQTMAVIALRIPVVLSFEIALLVSIREHRNDRLEVQIESRVYLSREQTESNLVRWRSDFRTHSFDNMFCGEVLPPTQVWFVDGPPPKRSPQSINGEKETTLRRRPTTKERVDDMWKLGSNSYESESEAVEKEPESWFWSRMFTRRRNNS